MRLATAIKTRLRLFRRAPKTTRQQVIVPLREQKPLRPTHKVRLGMPDSAFRADTLIISDIHLGSEVSRAKQLREALQEWYPFRRLIILGDLFEDLNFSRLRKHHFGLIDDFRRLTSPRRGVRVDWIEGNHDEAAHDVVRAMIGANVQKELIVEMAGKRHLFMHGHQFDDFLTDHPIISTVAGKFYEAVQKRETRTRSVSRWLKRKSKGWIGVCRKVERKAIEHAMDRNVDYIFCGHTHYHEASKNVHPSGIQYVNTGCWTDAPSTILTLGPEGIRRHLYT